MSDMIIEHWLDLRCHRSARSGTVRAIKVLVRRSETELQVTFLLEGDISQIRVRSSDMSRIATQLWRSTCFEAFIAVDGQPAYHEFNFAPSGEWAVYAFRGYRSGGLLDDETLRPHIAVSSADSWLKLEALVRLDSLSAIHPHAPLRMGLSAIIEAPDGFSYWALRHPDGKPDFHDAGGFALLLEPPHPDRRSVP